jgi:hypothetical protein
LARKGEIVLGQAVSSELDRDSDGDVQLKIVYQFISPHTDTMLTGYSYAQRNDISHDARKRSPDAPIPAQKPVAILYHQDNDYLIL